MKAKLYTMSMRLLIKMWFNFLQLYILVKVNISVYLSDTKHVKFYILLLGNIDLY